MSIGRSQTQAQGVSVVFDWSNPDFLTGHDANCEPRGLSRHNLPLAVPEAVGHGTRTVR